LPSGQFDIVIVGGGLAGALIAWRLHVARPDISFVLIEKGDHLGGNHTWSFHSTDLSKNAFEWISPLVSWKWPEQRVRFPSYERTLSTSYHSITSEHFHQVLSATLGGKIRCGETAVSVEPNQVVLESGDIFEAEAVIDARGAIGSDALTVGFQKFVGQMIELAEPHNLVGPTIMDADVEQRDGYRFIYVLPISNKSILIEDTRYTDGNDFSIESYRQGVLEYCLDRSWEIKTIGREEEGVLPIALGGDIRQFLAQTPAGIAPVGMRAGLFHPLTGYSLPDAVQAADMIIGMSDLSGPALNKSLRTHAISVWNKRSYYRFLCRMLFGAAKPHLRYKVLERFYKMPEPLIERFYAGTSTTKDRIRILAGKPPVPIFKAMRCLRESNQVN